MAPSRSGRAPGWLAFAVTLATLGATPLTEDDGGRFSVYLRVLDSTELTLDQVVTSLSSAFAREGWEVLAIADVGGVDGECESTARTLVLHEAAYAERILQNGPHAAFAVPIKLSVFEDELGVHVGLMDPRSLNRTMVAEEGLDDDWADLTEALLSVVEGEFPGQVNPVGYGQWRDKGRIGRTFGIMAGGPFSEKIETVVELPGADFQPIEIANTLLETMELAGDWEWGMKGIFALDLGPDLALLGVTGTHMENRAFRIVGKGNQKEREDLQCAGVDHAPAFPLNLAIQRVGDEIHVTLVDEMFRMKMYFEDAGKMAFARNMGMPGSIENEIRQKVELIVSNMN